MNDLNALTYQTRPSAGLRSVIVPVGSPMADGRFVAYLSHKSPAISLDTNARYSTELDREFFSITRSSPVRLRWFRNQFLRPALARVDKALSIPYRNGRLSAHVFLILVASASAPAISCKLCLLCPKSCWIFRYADSVHYRSWNRRSIRTIRDDALPPASNQRMFRPNVRHVSAS